jgi:hypothetical protein
MKPAHIILGITAAALTAFAAVSADSSSAVISARYISASELYDALKLQLGPTASSAVVSVDIRANALKLDEAHPDATKVRELVAKLDQRPPTVKVQATIKRVTAATPTTKAREEILSRPTLFGRTDRPMSITFGDAAHESFTVELVVTPTTEPPK